MLEGIAANAIGGVIAVLVVGLYDRFVAKQPQLLKRRQALIVFSVAFVIIFLTDLTPMPVGETIRVRIFGPLSQNEAWTIAAWRDFKHNEYDAAILSANKVVDLYGGMAMRQQEALESQKEPAPPTGRVFPWESGTVFSRGILNDVASSYWVLGQAYESRGKGCEAKSAYAAASKLTYGRAWDPQWWPIRGWSPVGWFWQPAELAQDRVAKMVCLEPHAAK